MKYDIAIIGGGPAGMMAAGRAGELGSSVILLEKNKELGVKLLITGNGRCNFSNKKNNPGEFINQFARGGKFLFSALHEFSIDDTIDFFEKRGVATKVEKDGKIFPKSDRAIDIKNALLDYLKKFGVEIKTGIEVLKIVKDKKSIKKIILADKTEIIANNYIICTGGKSFPITGSTGVGYNWAKELGHNIVKPVPVLTPVILKDSFIKNLQGLSFSDVKLNIYKSNEKTYSLSGDIIFTDNGISGPTIMDMSRLIARENMSELLLEIDFFRANDMTELDLILQNNFKKDNNKVLKNCLDSLIPPRLSTTILKLADIDPGQKVHSIKKEDRKKILHFLKKFQLPIKGLSGFERAYLTSGGIALNEIEPNKMRSKLIKNLYFAGEILDLDGPTGGYNLQVCWSTGYLAGSKAHELN